MPASKPSKAILFITALNASQLKAEPAVEMPKKRGKLITKTEYYAVRLLLGAVGIFPLKTSMSLGRGIGGFFGHRSRRLQKTARRNLEIALPGLPESEKQRIITGTFERLGRHLGFVSHFK